MLPFPEGELGLPVAEPFPFPGKKAPPSEEEDTTFTQTVLAIKLHTTLQKLSKCEVKADFVGI